MADENQEPSMEEILSSIRRIISDDDEEPEEAPAQPEPEPEPVPEPEPEAALEDDDDDILELTELAPEPPPPAIDDEDRLLSDASAAAASAALSRLSLTGGTRVSEDTLLEITKVLLRPLLKEWLDNNLPGMVERMVQQEIQRLTRGS